MLMIGLLIRLGFLDSIDFSDRAVMSLRLAVGGCISGRIRPVLNRSEPCEAESHCSPGAKPRSLVWPRPKIRTNADSGIRP